MQSAATKLKQVADRKVADQDLINQRDAADITSAEAKLHGGQTPPDSISSKAQVRLYSILVPSLSICSCFACPPAAHLVMLLVGVL